MRLSNAVVVGAITDSWYAKEIEVIIDVNEISQN